MKPAVMTASLAAVILASCGLSHRFATSSVETHMPRDYFLIVAPFTREFPGGDMHAPLYKWSKVTTFDTREDCDAMLMQAANQLQRPVQCIASDDPALQVVDIAR